MSIKLPLSFFIVAFVSANTGFAVTTTGLENNPESGLKTTSIHSRKAPRATFTIDVDEDHGLIKKNSAQSDPESQKNPYFRERNPFLTDRCKLITSLMAGVVLALAVVIPYYFLSYCSCPDSDSVTANFTEDFRIFLARKLEKLHTKRISSQIIKDPLVWFQDLSTSDEYDDHDYSAEEGSGL